MTFEGILSVLLSILLPKFIEKKKKEKIGLVLKVGLIIVICLCITQMDSILGFVLNPDALQKWSGLVNNAIIQFFVIVVISIGIYFTYKMDLEGTCNFKSLQKKIENFTEKAWGNRYESSKLYILCGDMDVWGECEESEEFKQLVKLQNSNQELDIRILCKHCINDDYIKEICKKTYIFDPEEFEKNIKRPDQIKRIVDFKERVLKCSFRFYKEPSDDKSHLRARVLSNTANPQVLLYRKTERKFGRIMQHVNRLIKKDTDEYVYEYEELIDNESIKSEKMNYIELCDLKWSSCDAVLAEKIVNLCEQYMTYKKANKHIKKIAFLYAKTYEVAHYGTSRVEFPPFGVLYLSTSVKKYCSKWIPDVIALEENLFLENNRLIERLSVYDVIAFSIVSAYTIPLFVKTMSLIKNTISDKKPLCIAGGYQAEIEGEQLLKKKLVSLILRGEGEESIVQLLNGNNTLHFGEKLYEKIPGAYYLSKGKLKTSRSPKCIDLNKVPIPDRSYLPSEYISMTRDIAGEKYKIAHIIMSRGCSYECAYCGVRRTGNRVVRYRDADNIRTELMQLKEIYDIEGFSIIDDCFLTNKNKAIEILKKIKDVNLIWSLAARIDQIDDDILKYLKESGCKEIKFGLETGSDKLLKDMEKGITVEQAREVLNKVYDFGLSAKVFIISGLPGEDDRTNQETIDFLKEMGTEKIKRISLLRFVPLPGSKVYENPQKYGIRLDIKNRLDSLDKYKQYRLYEEETNWWEDEEEFYKRNEYYKKIKEFIDSKWGKEVY